MMKTIILIASLGGEYSSTRKIATLLKQLRENFYIDCRLNLASVYFPSDRYGFEFTVLR